MSRLVSRRNVLFGSAALAAAVALERIASPDRPRRGTSPVHWVFFQLSGGVDAIFTTDPKERRDVEPWVDVPYTADAIGNLGAIQVGPHLASLAHAARRPAIVNGVRIHTANHFSGRIQIERMRVGSLVDAPMLAQIIGEHRAADIPLAHAAQTWLDGSLDGLFDTSNADFERLARALAHVASRPSPGSSTATTRSYRDSSALMHRLAATPRFAFEPWAPAAPRDQPQAATEPGLDRELQRALWLIEHDVCACTSLLLGAGQRWDTHSNNTEGQTMASTSSFPLIARFLTELEHRSCRHGLLADHTVVVIASEIGRYPAINGNLGKDHLPEIPIVLYGPGIATGRDGARYGQTGRHMEALAVDHKTGAGRRGGDFIELDDVGATLLHLAGVADPSLYGYRGRILPFLVG
jgi:hypothetical protein